MAAAAMTSTNVKAKGSTIRSTLAYVEEVGGAELLERVLARLTPAVRGLVRGAQATDELPFNVAVALWTAAESELAPLDGEWMEKAGAYSIQSTGVQLYSGILRKSTPLEFLTQGISLFRLYYHPGDMQVVEHEETRAVLRLLGFDHGTNLFCRRQTGGLQRALALAGGGAPVVRHVRCVIEGDAFCEWEMRWSELAPEAPR
jgi:hypothetical protein